MRAGGCLCSLALALSTLIRLVVSSKVPTQDGHSLRTLLSESDHKYEMHDQIRLFANKVGPFSNPR